LSKLIYHINMRIPDLRNNPEITTEHCSVLLERLSKTFDLMDGQDGFDLTNEIDPQVMKAHYEEWFEVEAFERLFVTEMGKGVLVGSFLHRLLEKMEEADADH